MRGPGTCILMHFQNMNSPMFAGWRAAKEAASSGSFHTGREAPKASAFFRGAWGQFCVALVCGKTRPVLIISVFTSCCSELAQWPSANPQNDPLHRSSCTDEEAKAESVVSGSRPHSR